MYASPCGHAAAFVKELGEGDFEVDSVATSMHARGQGLQRALWKKLLADADKERVCLLITVGSGRGAQNGGLDSKGLFDWYVRLGFHGLAGGGNGDYSGTRMERWPGGHEALEVFT